MGLREDLLQYQREAMTPEEAMRHWGLNEAAPNPKQPPDKPAKPKCINCKRELCEVLDAYYGSVKVMKEICLKCRRP